MYRHLANLETTLQSGARLVEVGKPNAWKERISGAADKAVLNWA